MSQSQLAAALGIEHTTVSRWERGKVDPQPYNVRAVAELADLPVAWFYNEEAEAVA